MIYSEKQYKLLVDENKKIKKENELKSKEIKLLKQQNSQKDEIIHDLDSNNYKQKYNIVLTEKNILSAINNEQKSKSLKKSKRLTKAIRDTESKNRKRQ